MSERGWSWPFLCLAAGYLLAAAPAPGAASNGQRGLLIVAPAHFHPGLAEFAAHKSKLLPTRLVALEDALNTPGVDDPEKLKRFLHETWKRDRIGYVLLVGDVDRMPVRYMVLDRITPAAFDYSFYPSDLYYADLAKADGSFDDWNARKEGFHGGYFGEVRGEKNKSDPINYDEVDYRPDVAVGRWPVSTTEELKRVARKSMARENAVLKGSDPGLERAAFIAVGGWVDSRRLLHGLASMLEGNWSVERRFYGPGGPVQTPPPDHAEVLGLFNRGLGLAVHTGHGQPDAWEQCFSAADLRRITNAALPVVISAGCSTAYFAPLAPYGAYVDTLGAEHKGSDNGEVFHAPPPPAAPYQRGRFNPTGLGELMLKQEETGAAAYIGCNTGSQPCGLTLVEGFVSALAEPGKLRLGDCWSAAIRHYYEKERLAELKPDDGWYPPSIFFQGMKFMVFGDPALVLR